MSITADTSSGDVNGGIDVLTGLVALAHRDGPNPTVWPGLTVYRFTEPMPSQWAEVDGLSLCFVAQGRKRVHSEHFDVCYDPFRYLLFTRGERFQAEILEASNAAPFLSMVLQIDPAVVRAIALNIVEKRPQVGSVPLQSAAPCVEDVDRGLAGALGRFLAALGSDADRRILGPIVLNEIVYRLLQSEHCPRITRAAALERASCPVAKAIEYIRAHLDGPIAVTDLAAQVQMSPSAFARLFRETAGQSPYQFVKSERLDAARSLLFDGELNVSEVAWRVGYSSLSHFINEFRRHIGVSPRKYAESQRGSLALLVRQATDPR
jgi:AraC-like DNA-binding protein